MRHKLLKVLHVQPFTDGFAIKVCGHSSQLETRIEGYTDTQKNHALQWDWTMYSKYRPHFTCNSEHRRNGDGLWIWLLKEEKNLHCGATLITFASLRRYLMTLTFVTILQSLTTRGNSRADPTARKKKKLPLESGRVPTIRPHNLNFWGFRVCTCCKLVRICFRVRLQLLTRVCDCGYKRGPAPSWCGASWWGPHPHSIVTSWWISDPTKGKV